MGQPPEFSPVKQKDEEKKVSVPMPQSSPQTYRLNSLWQPGARAFFKDQRANQVGDILTVNVNITDNATVSNTTAQSRNSSENSIITNLFGTETITTTGGNPITNGLNAVTSGKPSHEGKGNVTRSESIAIKLAVLITQNLPNGNLVIYGKQEIRVNNELREIEISGIVRPQDIGSENIIPYEKIAEARISYGGRGQITDVQTPRWGYQLMEALSPM